MKKRLVLALALVLVLSLAACGGGGSGTPSSSAAPPSSADPGGAQQTGTPESSVLPSETPRGDGGQEPEIDLSVFTAVELPASALLEDWMKPDFGVITIANGEQLWGSYYSFTISGVTKANEESYRSLIESNGWAASSAETYDKDKKQIALGTAAVGKTKESIMTVTITAD